MLKLNLLLDDLVFVLVLHEILGRVPINRTVTVYPPKGPGSIAQTICYYICR